MYTSVYKVYTAAYNKAIAHNVPVLILTIDILDCTIAEIKDIDFQFNMKNTNINTKFPS